MRNLFYGLIYWMRFVGIGLVVAGIGEMQFSVFIRADIQNLIGSFAFNAVYLTLAGVLSRLTVKCLGDSPVTLILHTAGSGGTGLLIEWFLIGNSPWGNPQASQIGMFAFWSAMVLVPFISLRPQAYLDALKRRMGISVLLYTLAALLIQLIPNPMLHFIYHIWSVIIGYTALVVLCFVGYLKAIRRGKPSGEPN